MRSFIFILAMWLATANAAFAQSPPPQPPPRVACPTIESQVFFDWDRANLTPQALETIDAIAERARQCSVRRVTIVGGMDTTGPDPYTLELARRQGQNVRDALIDRGIPGEAIEMESRGSEFVPVQTGDGVREPQNRVTSIQIEFQ